MDDQATNTKKEEQQSSAEQVGLPPSASASSLPKLRLTLKLPSSSAASSAAALPPAEDPAASSLVSSAPSSAVKTKKKPAAAGAKVAKPRAKSAGPKGSKPSNLVLVSTGDGKTAASSTTTAAPTEPSRPEKKELPAQFAEQIQQLKEMRKFKARKWTQSQVIFKTISGSTMVLPIWAREGHFAHEEQPVVGPAGSRRPSIDGIKEIPTESFPCTEAGCSKIFDAKDKLRRHVLLHKRKAAKLQLKLPNLKLVHKQESVEELAPSSQAPEQEEAMVPPSEPPSDMLMDTASQLESQT